MLCKDQRFSIFWAKILRKLINFSYAKVCIKYLNFHANNWHFQTRIAFWPIFGEKIQIFRTFSPLKIFNFYSKIQIEFLKRIFINLIFWTKKWILTHCGAPQSKKCRCKMAHTWLWVAALLCYENEQWTTWGQWAFYVKRGWHLGNFYFLLQTRKDFHWLQLFCLI